MVTRNIIDSSFCFYKVAVLSMILSLFPFFVLKKAKFVVLSNTRLPIPSCSEDELFAYVMETNWEKIKSKSKPIFKRKLNILKGPIKFKFINEDGESFVARFFIYIFQQKIGMFDN